MATINRAWFESNAKEIPSLCITARHVRHTGVPRAINGEEKRHGYGSGMNSNRPSTPSQQQNLFAGLQGRGEENAHHTKKITLRLKRHKARCLCPWPKITKHSTIPPSQHNFLTQDSTTGFYKRAKNAGDTKRVDVPPDEQYGNKCS